MWSDHLSRKTLSLFILLLKIYAVTCKEIFQIELSELNSLVSTGQAKESLGELFRTEGALAVTSMPEEYSRAVRRLKSLAPHCLGKLKYPEFYMPDGSQRRTFAMDNLSDKKDFPECIKEESEAISRHFDTVDVLMSKIITSIARNNNLLWKTHGEDSEQAKNFSSSMKKEHIHVYEPLEGATDDGAYPVPFHTDNGLLLTITPFQELPLELKNKAGDIVTTGKVGEDAILVLVASGLPKWLLEGTETSPLFFPVPHAVPSLVNTVSPRTVFARMKVVPGDSFPTNKRAEKIKEKRMFQDFFTNTHHHSGVEELCPMQRPAYQVALEKSMSAVTEKWSSLKKHECETNEAYCWMNCLEVPSCRPNETLPIQCTNKAGVQCCTDTITENCADMDQSCQWKCTGDNSTNKFCNGQGTDMYMKGFTTSGDDKDACVILLFKSWVLDTRIKFFFGCVGVIILGIGIEGMLCLRRELQSRKILLRIRGLARRASIILLFAVNIATGYFAMLVAMTYSVELFICMVIGLVLGHAIFNSGAPVGESVDPCCASQREELLLQPDDYSQCTDVQACSGSVRVYTACGGEGGSCDKSQEDCERNCENC